MSFTSLIAIFIGIGILAVVSIFFGILNWINLVATSSSINRLQIEIEKKYKESDFQKKDNSSSDEYTSSQSLSTAQPVIQEQSQQLQIQTPQPEEKQQQIEIIRNVRGEFSSAGQPNMQSEINPIPEPISTDPVSSEETGEFQQPSIVQDQIVPEIKSGFSSPVDSRKEEKVSEENFQVFDDQGEALTQPPMETNSITIPLYSNASQDADFNALWKTLTLHFKTTDHLQVTIDFRNILFLYEKEIEYLRKIYKAIEINQGTLSFIQCSSELISALNNDPLLKTLIMKE